MRDTELYDEDTDTYYGLDYVDEDDDYDRYHCEHGTYIGTPGGPDILCHYCEMGYSRKEFEDEMRWRRLSAIRSKAKMVAFQMFIDVVYPTWKHMPGGFDGEQFKAWADNMRDEIDGMSDSDLLLIENDVYSY